MTIDENTKKALEYFEHSALFQGSNIAARQKSNFRMTIAINASPFSIKYNNTLPPGTISILKVTDNGSFNSLTAKAMGIKIQKIFAAASQNWSLSTYSEIGHSNGLPNYTAGALVVYAPDDLKTNVGAALKKFVATGIYTAVLTYEAS